MERQFTLPLPGFSKSERKAALLDERFDGTAPSFLRERARKIEVKVKVSHEPSPPRLHEHCSPVVSHRDSVSEKMICLPPAANQNEPVTNRAAGWEPPSRATAGPTEKRAKVKAARKQRNRMNQRKRQKR